MGQILGLGVTHSPPLLSASGDTASRLKRMMQDPLLPECYRSPATWPEPMRQQWGNDEGQTHSQQHRDELVECMRWSRKQLDDFNPDLVIVFGDDQYENFREDGVPAFQINCFESFAGEALGARQARPQRLGRGARHSVPLPGQPASRQASRHTAHRGGLQVAYAYEPRHDAMPHAILNTLLFLDWDRRGFDYPIVPFLTNCYGRQLTPLRGRGVNNLADVPQEDDLDPPGPTPWRCFDLGRALARILTPSPWRVALVASASWSHSFLSGGTSYFHPHVEADRLYFDAMVAGDYEFWRKTTLQDIEEHGHQETLNWLLMLGAMAELGGRKPQEARFVESWLTNANKVFAVFRP